MGLSPDLPAAGAVAALVETVEAVGEVGREAQLDLVPPASGQHRVGQEGQLVGGRILQDPERPDALGGQQVRAGDLHVLCVEDHGAGVLVHVEQNADDAREVQRGQVGVEAQVIVDGGHRLGESHASPGEGLAVGGPGDVFDLAMVWYLRCPCGCRGIKQQQEEEERRRKHDDNKGRNLLSPVTRNPHIAS